MGCSTGLGDIGGVCFGVYDFGVSGSLNAIGFDVLVYCLIGGTEF